MAGLVKQTRLVGGNHVFDVDKRVVAAAAFKRFERLVNQIAEVLTVSLAVLDTVTQIHCVRPHTNTPTATYCRDTQQLLSLSSSVV